MTTFLQAGDRVVGNDPGNVFGPIRALRAIPLDRPVERAEERTRRDCRVRGGQLAAANACRHQRSDAALVAVALGDDGAAQPRGQRVHLEMRRRSFDLIEHAQHVGDRQLVEPLGERPAMRSGCGCGGEEPFERAILTEEQDFVFAGEVVVQVAGRKIGGDGDIAHARGDEPAGPEHLRRGAQDIDASLVGPPLHPLRRGSGTAVRRMNHGSIFDPPRPCRQVRGVAARKRAPIMGTLMFARLFPVRARHVASVLVTAAFVSVLRFVPTITARAAVPVLLLGIVIIARTWGTGPALLASATAAFGYSYYFLPQVSLADEELAIISFTVSAIIVGELAARAERRKREAQAGRQEIERLYQELRAAFDRASEAEAARRNEELKAALLDALTHNLRTPLTAIKASVTALMGKGEWDEAAGLSAEGRRELLQVIDEESDRLNRFIEGLSAADRRDPAQPLRFRSVRIEDIVKAGLARADTVTRHHHVDVAIEPAIPPLVVDAAAVAEVIYILLDNASKYSPAGTAIRVTASRQNATHVCIEVADEGPGVPPMLRERVFDKFFRIHDHEPSDARRAGIGLGLPIARRLVEAQSGRIWIETPASRTGTAVIMTLPISVEAAMPDAVVSAPPALSS
jgi:signal transduction histidine kinase